MRIHRSHRSIRLARVLAPALPVLAALTLLAAAPARAHDDAWLDTQSAPHGGQLRMAGPLHLELVLAKDANGAKDAPVFVYVTDHAGTPVPTAGAKGSVTLLSGKTRLDAELKPDGENRLKGTARYTAGSDLKAVVRVTPKGQDEAQARFTPLAPRGAAARNDSGGAGDTHSGHAH